MATNQSAFLFRKGGPRPGVMELQTPCLPYRSNSQASALTYPRIYQPFRAPLIPSAAQEHHTRKVLSNKPYFVPSATTGVAKPRHILKAPQGYGRNQSKGLADRADGIDHRVADTATLLIKANSNYAALNSTIGR